MSLSGIPEHEQAKPPARAELRKEERASQALALYIRDGMDAVVKQLGVSRAHANVLVNRGLEDWRHHKDEWIEQEFAKDAMRLAEMTEEFFRMSLDAGLMSRERAEAGRTFLAAAKRKAELLDLDLKKEQSGPVFNFIEARLPDERPEVIEGEIVPPDA